MAARLPTELTLDLDGFPVRVIDGGAGPCVLMVHDIGASADAWSLQVGALVEGGFRVLVPDLRGFGGGPDGRGNVGHAIDDLRAVTRLLGVPAVHVVGDGRGAEVAWMFANTLAGKVDRLVVINSAYPAADRFPPVRQAVLAIWRPGATSVTEAMVQAARPHVAGSWRYERVEPDATTAGGDQLNSLLLEFLAPGPRKRRPEDQVRQMVGRHLGGALTRRLRTDG